ncbi:hypothetical protein IE81DRAFT_322096 [Ceraceosorus guamensis]|uniref:Uncharacterized protein n=1 Tax=Ceraceosorus guamensis TaxID=1522189 RepID=A0A316W6K7_9BASI|nr:hypothetical protein IE81DRAFT_322096 [Ceraceosorus guamensis]PWN43693.1 hypothetical protein IE81DRAFT_322096 [Ceraceosorus guamensis]
MLGLLIFLAGQRSRTSRELKLGCSTAAIECVDATETLEAHAHAHAHAHTHTHDYLILAWLHDPSSS